jgi:hypothetical protein
MTSRVLTPADLQLIADKLAVLRDWLIRAGYSETEADRIVEALDATYPTARRGKCTP